MKIGPVDAGVNFQIVKKVQIESVTTQMGAIESYFPVVLSVFFFNLYKHSLIVYKVILALASVDIIANCDHSN